MKKGPKLTETRRIQPPNRRSAFREFLSKNVLTVWILIGLLAGLAIGHFAPGWVPYLKPFQNLFLKGIKCAIAPLIFATVVTGFASAGTFKQLGIMGLRTFIYFEVVTTMALGTGLFMVNLMKPGVGVQIGHVSADQLANAGTAANLSFSGFIEHLLPANFVDAVARGDVLQIVIYSMIFGVATLAVGPKAKPVLEFCEALSEVMFKFVRYALYLAPIGVCSALASAVAESGLAVMIPLLKLVGTLYLALILFAAVFLAPICRFYGISFLSFLKQVKEPVLFAFATTSSESAYPLAIQKLEAFGVPRRIVSFVMPLGYSFNLDGSTLYLSLASVFVAQAAGIDLSLYQQLLILLTLMLTSKGIAGVPRVSIIVLSATLATFGLPLEGIGLIIGVDTFMDMGRSAMNLLGNCQAAAIIARSEGIELGTPIVEVEEFPAKPGVLQEA